MHSRLMTKFDASPLYDSSSRTKSMATVLSEYLRNTCDNTEHLSTAQSLIRMFGAHLEQRIDV